MTDRDDRTPVEYVREEFRLEHEDEEPDTAAAVHSVADETRTHGEADETDVVQGAGGELRDLDAEEDFDE